MSVDNETSCSQLLGAWQQYVILTEDLFNETGYQKISNITDYYTVFKSMLESYKQANDIEDNSSQEYGILLVFGVENQKYKDVQYKTYRTAISIDSTLQNITILSDMNLVAWYPDSGFNTNIENLRFDNTDTYYQIVDNINEHQFMPDFYYSDLQWAEKQFHHNKIREDDILYQYLSQQPPQKFAELNVVEPNMKQFNEVLQPKYFPLGRYPTNPEYALSVMQQITVNLASHMPNISSPIIQGVNGAPGTGKTTLLRDIFADFIVQQAHDIVKYHKSLDILLPLLQKRSIIVVSNNNAAVRNVIDSFNFETTHNNSENILKDGLDDRSKESLETLISQYGGNFAAAGGNKSNMEALKNTVENILEMLEEVDSNSIDSIYDDFNQQYEALNNERQHQQKLCEALTDLYEYQHQYQQYIQEYESITAQCQQHYQQRPWWWRLSPRWYHEYKHLTNEQQYNIMNRERLVAQLYTLQNTITELSHSTSIDSQNTSFDLSQQSLSEETSYWFDSEYRAKQNNLLITALKVRRAFLSQHINDCKTALDISGKLNRKYWTWLTLVIPVISSTLASVRKLDNQPNMIGCLFCDEAGQVLPYSLVGSLLRCRHALIIGDPYQIQPILKSDSLAKTIDTENNIDPTQQFIKNNNIISAQNYADNVSYYGIKQGDHKIGIPLRLHRRCPEPMFSTSNELSYDNTMVLAQSMKNKQGVMQWYHVKGSANNKFVEEQFTTLKTLLKDLQKNYDLGNDIFIITPYKNVAAQVRRKLRQFAKNHADNAIKNSLIKLANKEHTGTIHTFQGKENKVVIMIMGGDQNTPSANEWVQSQPNMFNVAVSRATQVFYVIGDTTLFKENNGQIVQNHCNIIESSNKNQLNVS